MIFRRKKSTEPAGGAEPVMRGRNSAKEAENPLARRFQADDEPDTIDLQQPARFNEEPDTAEKDGRSTEPGGLDVITHVAATGKFYVQPGTAQLPVFLGDDPVTAPTELRRGDRIHIAGVEFHIRRSEKS